MQNYFNYFTEIEDRFQQRRGAILLLSTLDWALIETWRDAGIPLEAVLRGIDAAFDKYEALLRPNLLSKQEGARRFAAAFAPTTRWGLFLRNQVIRAFAIPGLARLAIGSNIADNLELPDYRWPAFASAVN